MTERTRGPIFFVDGTFPARPERGRNQGAETGGSDKPAPPDRGDDDQELDVREKTRAEIPRRYKVLFHNDDYTTMEFVVECLMTFFHKSETEATHIMLTVHRKGSAVAGIYSREIAETKVDHVMEHARKHGMPLLLTAEPE